MASIKKLQNYVNNLTRQHRELDEKISSASPSHSDLEISEMKREKLYLKEKITTINKQLEQS